GAFLYAHGQQVNSSRQGTEALHVGDIVRDRLLYLLRTDFGHDEKATFLAQELKLFVHLALLHETDSCRKPSRNLPDSGHLMRKFFSNGFRRHEPSRKIARIRKGHTVHKAEEVVK